MMKQSHLDFIDEYLQRGELSKAVRAVQRALRAGVDPAACYYRLAELHRRQQHWRQAIQAARQAVNSAPDQMLCRELLLDILLESGSVEDAVRESLAWLEYAPDSLSALESLARAYWLKSDLEKALRVTERLLQLHPVSPEYRFQRAQLLQQMGDFAGCVQDYMQLLAMNAPEELHFLALESLDNLDRWQLQLIITLLMENPPFRVAFAHDRYQAVQSRGFRLSDRGYALLEFLPTEFSENDPVHHRHAPPN